MLEFLMEIVKITMRITYHFIFQGYICPIKIAICAILLF